ncbi:hypothetical protein [Bradyrhizobium sp. LTSP857]|uniref:hypothetical protein n=1 Tax=Bradyrhizobium sp. LTSP857 TaxID=1619231 RepID=UPI0009E4996A|nr:hypothetical protein [Bradyrhizobium sp. LTSP857]
MIELALAGLIAFAALPPTAVGSEPVVQEIQFRGGPGGQCPDGFAFNYSDGRCYRNGRQPPGEYARPQYRRGGSCPDGYDFNYSDGNCYPNRGHAPGAYGRPQYGGESGQCPDGFAYNYSNGRCYRNGMQPPGMYAR